MTDAQMDQLDQELDKAYPPTITLGQALFGLLILSSIFFCVGILAGLHIYRGSL